jgi:DNA-binding transcriptional LysR family regulator
MNREVHVRICEGLGVKLPGPTRQNPNTSLEIARGRAALRVNNGDMMRGAALSGIGISLLPMFIIGSDVTGGSLRIIDVGVRSAPEFIDVAHLEGRRPSATLRAFADCLREVFGDPPYWEH